MNYCELSESDDEHMVDDGVRELLAKVREVFDIDIEDVDVPYDDEYMMSFEKFKDEYKNSMKIFLENFRKFDKKQKMSQELTGFIYRLSSKSGTTYLDQMKQMCNDFMESEGIEELKKDLENSQKILRKFFKISSLAKELNINNDYMCYICLERGFDTMIEPCGHVICNSCSKGAIQQCPFCRSDITKFKKLIIG